MKNCVAEYSADLKKKSGGISVNSRPECRLSGTAVREKLIYLLQIGKMLKTSKKIFKSTQIFFHL
jgi:hypothetical protein